MKKIVSIMIMVVIFFTISNISVYATTSVTDVSGVITSMSGANNMAGTDNSFGKAINTIIGLLQIAGTGISIIVVSMLGIKYLLASPSEKADTKKSIMPIVIGCVLLFGAVNIMAAVSDYAQKVFE